MNETRFFGSAALVTAVFLFLAAPLNAHHSFAMYDEVNPIKISGTVAKYSWANPHMIFWVAVIDKQNKATIWTIESPFGPSTLGRYGWDKQTLKAGDKVELWISPLKQGGTGGSLEQLIFLDSGKVLYNGSRGKHGSPPASGTPAPGARGPGARQ